MSKTLKELASEALGVQNACNLCGVAQSFARAMRDLMIALPRAGTDEINAHPITIAWSDKIAHLTGTQDIGNDRTMKAFTECARIANA